ncbi:hypothetical protein Scep_030985 [Stephania cephalantha]|uniref:Uncharacterized protein n=1 Tax=Stephania cephalantha TaxID=152367 RepID=A0AAP0DU20_9MAGN
MAHQADVNRAQIDMLTTEKVEWRPWEDSFHWHQDCVVSAIEHFSGRACLNKIATIAGQPRLGSFKAISYGLENSDKKPNREGLNGWLPRPGLAPAQLTCFAGRSIIRLKPQCLKERKQLLPVRLRIYIPTTFPRRSNQTLLKWEENPMDCGGFIKHSPLFERVHLRKEVAPTYSFETAQLAKSSFALFEKLKRAVPSIPNLETESAKSQADELYVKFKKERYSYQAETGTRAENGWKGDISDILQQRRPRSGSKGFSSVYQLMIMCYLFDRPFASSVVNSALAWNIFEIPFVKRKFYHISFVAGQPLGYYASWPLFALSPSHGCVVGCRAGSACSDGMGLRKDRISLPVRYRILKKAPLPLNFPPTSYCSAAPSVTVYSCATDSQRPDSIAVDEIVVVLQRAKSPLLLLWEKAPSQLSHLNKE